MDKIGRCALCGKTANLRLSHIIPQFAGKWLKGASATGYLRGTPNQRRQDIDKLNLLCSSCEGLFERNGETLFSRKIFHPFQASNQNFQRFDYDEWLLYFAISLAWRTTVTQLESFRAAEPRLAQYANIAVRYWADYLLQESSDPGPYEHHIFFFGYLNQEESDDILHGIHTYMLGSVDHTIGYGADTIFAYTKLPGIVFWSTIQPFYAEEWQNTLIAKQGTLQAPQVSSTDLGDMVESCVGKMMTDIRSISERQRQQIHRTLANDPSKFKGSTAWKILQADRYAQDQEET